MSEATVIKPDLDFVKGVIAAGGESLKKCYQCSTCTVVCNVTPDKEPFPRKEMLWAQWGLKEKFQGNPDVWLCHQCNDCTAYCPRGAKPGEVLGAIRKQTIKQYSQPAALVDLVNNKAMMLMTLLIPTIIVGLIVSLFGNWSPEGEVIYSQFLPYLPIQIVFTPALLFGAGVGIMGMKKFWADMKTANNVHSGDVKGSAIAMFKEFMTHDRFKTCDVSKDRYTSHMLVFYGFVGAGIATALGVLYIDILGIHSPFGLSKGLPIKLFGTVGAVGIVAGILYMMSNRFKNEEKLGVGSYFDWLLLTIIGVVGISGLLAWLLRLAGVAPIAYPIYFIHLVFVFSLFVYLPFSKLAHMFYRGAALTFLKYSGREAAQEAAPVAPAAEAAEETEGEADKAEGEADQAEAKQE